MWFRLALMMSCSVREAQRRISGPEFSEWVAYSTLEPFGEEWANVRAAMICQTVANCLVEREDKKKFSIRDFLGVLAGYLQESAGGSAEPIQKTPEQLLDKAKQFQKMYEQVMSQRG